MRVAVISTYYPSEDNVGRYVFVHQRVKEYAKYFDVKVFRSGKEDYIFEGIPVMSGSIFRIRKEIEKFEPDVIVDHQANPKFSSLLYPFLKAPIITWIHGFEAMKSRYYEENPLATFMKLNVNRVAFKFPKKFVAVSNWMKEEAVRNCRIPQEKVAVIPNFIDDMFSYAERSYNKHKFISLRNFKLKYGLTIGIPACLNLPLEYHIVGTGSEYEYNRLLKLINGAHNIKIRNEEVPHEKVFDLYQQYNCFLAPSLEEAQGVAMCEAMATGMPVVATNVGGIPEFVRDGVDGLLAAPKVKDLRKAVRTFLTLDENEKKEMGRQASQHIKKLCNKKAIIEQEICVLEEVAE